MSVFTCTRCDGTGFLNIDQVDEATLAAFEAEGDPQIILDWIDERDAEMIEASSCTCMMHPRAVPCRYCENMHDVAPCDCCGNGEPWGWYFTPGLHSWDEPNDPKGCR